MTPSHFVFICLWQFNLITKFRSNMYWWWWWKKSFKTLLFKIFLKKKERKKEKSNISFCDENITPSFHSKMKCLNSFFQINRKNWQKATSLKSEIKKYRIVKTSLFIEISLKRKRWILPKITWWRERKVEFASWRFLIDSYV